MSHAIRIHETGGPDILRYEAIEVGDPGPGEIRIRQTAIGVNFIDTYHRSGLYGLELPSSIGVEGVGIIEATGEGVDVSKGVRVGYPLGPVGAYATHRIIPAEKVVVLPDWLDDEKAASVLTQGMTVEYLVRRCYAVKPGDIVLLHAAAGGTGLLACQWLKHLGAIVIGTMSNREKAEKAESAGCDFTVLYTQDDFVEAVEDITKGEGVDVVYDGVGKATLEGSLASLKTRGVCVAFGNASGAPDPVAPLTLSQLGSLYLTRPSLADYISTRTELEESSMALFEAIFEGGIEPDVGHTWPLKEAADAHRALENRETSGSIVLVP